MNKSQSQQVGLALSLALGSVLASCSMILGGDKNFVDLDSTSTSGGIATGSGGASGEVATGSSNGGFPAGSGTGAATTTGQGSSTGGCSPGQGGCGEAGTTGASSSSASSSASSSSGGPAPCGAGTLGSLIDTFTGSTLDAAQWGTYAAGNGSSATQTSNQISVFVPGDAGSSAGIYAQDAWNLSLLGCSASLKVLDSPKINGITTFFLLSAKSDDAYAIAFTQAGIYLNLEVNGPSGNKAFGQITYVKGVHVYWRFRETPGSGGEVHWDTSTDGVTWQEQFKYATSKIGFSLDKARVNFGLTGNGAPGTTVHFDNFNVAP